MRLCCSLLQRLRTLLFSSSYCSVWCYSHIIIGREYNGNMSTQVLLLIDGTALFEKHQYSTLLTNLSTQSSVIQHSHALITNSLHSNDNSILYVSFFTYYGCLCDSREWHQVYQHYTIYSISNCISVNPMILMFSWPPPFALWTMLTFIVQKTEVS